MKEYKIPNLFLMKMFTVCYNFIKEMKGDSVEKWKNVAREALHKMYDTTYSSNQRRAYWCRVVLL
jgi:hypothetical protein